MALVVTIIILIIIAGISINLLMGENGIIERAKQEKEQTLIAQYKEQIDIVKGETRLKYYGKETLENLKDEFDDDNKEYWVNNTEIITDDGTDKIKLTTNDGYIFYITEDIIEYKGKNGKVLEETTKITITANPSSQTENSVNKQEVELLVNSSKEWTEWSGKYAWNTSNTIEPSTDDWKSLTLEDNNSKEKTAEVEKTASNNGDYYLWVQITTNGITTTKCFGAYKLVSVPTESDIICTLKSKSDNDTKGIVELGSTKTFEDWTLSYILNDGEKTIIPQNTTTDINVVKNDYIEVSYSKDGQEVVTTLRVTELKIGYTLSYNATEGTGAPATQIGYSNTSSYTFTISSTIPTRENYEFIGWTINRDRTGTIYNSNDTITINENTTLYAQWEQWAFKNTVKAATCTEKGIDLYYLKDTTKTKQIETPSLGHKYSTTTSYDKEPTCTESGTQSYHCIRCNAIQEGTQSTVSATGHQFNEWESTSSVNICTTSGTARRTCQVCGIKETKSMPALGHDYQITNYECGTCGKTFTSIPSSHTNTSGSSCSGQIYVNKTCTRCNATSRQNATQMTQVILSSGNFDIRAITQNGSEIKSTYSNNGYLTTFRVNGSDITLNNTSGTITNGNCTLTRYITVNNENRAVIKYEVTNNSSNIETIGIAVDTDVMVGSNDSAPIYSNTYGIKMTDNTYNYQLYLRNTENVDNVDTIWFGKYSNRTSNRWNNCSITSLTNTDSGFAFSWKDRKIPANTTVSFTFMMALE